MSDVSEELIDWGDEMEDHYHKLENPEDENDEPEDDDLVEWISSTFPMNRGYHRIMAPIQIETDFMMPDVAEWITVRQGAMDDVTWDFEIPFEQEDMSSMRSGKREIERMKLSNARHNLVAEAISTTATDCPLSAHFESLTDGGDNLTPDFIFSKNRERHIVELTTLAVNNVRTAEQAYREKLFKYEEFLKARSDDMRVTMSVIVVTPRFILSGTQLPPRLCRDLFLRLHLALTAESLCKDKGIVIHQGTNTYVDLLCAEINREIKKAEFQNPEPSESIRITITNNFYEEVVNHKTDLLDVVKCFSSSLSKSVLDVKRDQSFDYTRHILEFEEMHRIPGNKTSPKPITIMPLCYCREGPSNTVPEWLGITSNLSAPKYIVELWNHCMEQTCNFKEEDTHNLITEAYETKEYRLEAMEQSRKSKRSKYRRVNIEKLKTKKEILKHLQDDGLCAKKMSKDAGHIARLRNQRAPFHYDTDTTDIDKFIESSFLLDESPGIDIPTDMWLSLIKTASTLNGNQTLNDDYMRQWVQTKGFKALDLISNIACELTISLKQNVRQEEFILKKLRYHDCYILIKPTNSKSHIFYSLYFPDLTEEFLINLPFRPLLEVETGRITEFCSVRADKLPNQLNASARFLSLISFWSDFYAMGVPSLGELSSNKEAMRMLNLSVLISLEDKAETEESITIGRYMYMEMFKSLKSPAIPNPFKMLSKYPTIIRSRLNLWVVKRMIANFSSMMVRVPLREDANLFTNSTEEDSLPGDSWEGLLNMFTGTKLNSASAAINLVYLGYLKDKNESSQGNAEMKLVEKIVEEEMKLDKARLEKSFGKMKDTDNSKGKEFNLNCVTHGCDLLSRSLKAKLGTDWKDHLDSEIMLALAHHLTHEISTLKASSPIEFDTGNYTLNIKDQEPYARLKVLEAISKKIELFTTNPMLNITSILTMIESTTRGVICDLFKKNQHGGLREIYVLNIESRIIQLFIETISRVICYQFEEETLTHPENKTKILDQHKVKVVKYSRKHGGSFASYCSSSDKTRWNQNLVMTVMSVPLFRLTTEKYHPMIQRCLNLWANKLIKMPPGVCKLLMSGTELGSPAFTRLREEYINPSKFDSKLFKGERSSMLNLTTGMMQGILHYTSSLLHLCFLYSFRTLVLRQARSIGEDFTCSMSQVCSSDDSAMILSIVTKSRVEDIPKDIARKASFSYYLLAAGVHYCNFFSMKESDKSTIGAMDYVEFNSEFLFRNTVAMPIIKFVSAAIGFSESESFTLRFHEMYNLISDLSASGFPFLNTGIVQISQSLLHYKSIGLYSSSLFKNYHELIRTYPDSVHGFFYLDSEYCCGLAGFSFCRWMAVKQNDKLLTSLKSIHKAELDVSPDGTIVEALNMKHGNLAKWFNLLDSIEGNTSSYSKSFRRDPQTKNIIKNQTALSRRDELVNSKPDLFFRHPETNDELRIKLLLKALMPGVSTSLSKGSPLIQAFSSTSYCLYSHSFTTTVLSKEGVDFNKRTKKISLLQSLSSRIETLVSGDLRDFPLENMFPMVERYEEINKLIIRYKNEPVIKTHALRHRKTVVRFHLTSTTVPLSLQQTLSKHWYDFTIKYGNKTFSRCLDHYKTLYPWIQNSFEDTLISSPFDTYMELFSFISSQESKNRTYRRVGPSISSHKFTNQCSIMIRKSFLRAHILGTTSIIPETPKHTKLMESIDLALQIPNERIRVQKVAHCMRNIARDYGTLDNIGDVGPKELVLTALSLFHDDKASINEMCSLFHKKSIGTLITYPQEQRRLVSDGKVKWVGYGKANVFSEGVEMSLEMLDDELTAVTLKDFKILRMNPGILREVMRRLGLKPRKSQFNGNMCSAKFDGNNFFDRFASGTPIITDKWFEIVKLEERDTKLEIKEGIILLTSRRSRKYTILSYRPSLNRISMESTFDESLDVYDAWVTKRRASMNTAKSFFKSLTRQHKDNPKKLETTKQWVKKTLMKRLRARGYTENVLYAETMISMEAESCEDDDELEMLWEQELLTEVVPMTKIHELIEDFNDQTFETILEDADRFFDIEMYRAVFSNYEAPESEMRVQGPNDGYISLHPIWDSFIDGLCRENIKYFRLVLSGMVPSQGRELAEILMYVMDICKKGEVPDPFAMSTAEDVEV